MATYNVRLDATKTAVVDFQNPGTNYSTEAFYGINQFKRMCLGVNPIPDSYNGKVLRSIEANIYLKLNEAYNWVNGYAMSSQWEESGITYGNQPEISPLSAQSNLIDSGKNWQKFVYTSNNRKLQDVITNGIVLSPLPFSYTGILFDFYTRQSAYKPYINAQLEDIVYDVSKSRLNPTEGFVGKSIDNIFSFSVYPPNTEYVGGVVPTPTAIKFRWRPLNGQTNEINLAGTQTSYTVPANTFTTDQIQWQITVVDGDFEYTSDWFTLTTVDSVSSAQAVSPVNVTVDGSQPVTFRWNHIIETGSDQTQYELEYSDDNGLEWTPLKSESTKNTYAEIPANTLPAGNLLWHVRTYNSDHVAGNWSEPAGFVVRAAPTAPSISSISAEPRPVVRWQAVGQQAYEISVYSGDLLIYTTGETAGTEKERKIQEYLQPGVYTVRMRVWNSYNMASPWGSGSVTVPNSEITPPFAAVSVGSGYAEIVGNGSSFQKFYILRDGVPIAKMQDGIYRDYAAVGTHTYVVRGVTANDLFADSEPQTATISLPYSMAAPVSALSEWVPMIYRRNADPAMTENIQSMGQAVFVSGRALPIFEQAEYWNNTLSFVYSYRTAEEYNKMRDLLRKGETVRYRGRDGTAYWMVLTGLQTNVDYLSRDFTLSAQEVDYVEEIPYDMEEG